MAFGPAVAMALAAACGSTPPAPASPGGDGGQPDASLVAPLDGASSTPDAADAGSAVGATDAGSSDAPPLFGFGDGATTLPASQLVGKLDLLFMVDNSASMGDKQALLAQAVPDLIDRLVRPQCLDGSGAPTGQTADTAGNCPAGSSAEFLPVQDIHIGIVDSSLGGRGGDECSASLPHNDDRGELINRGTTGQPLADASPDSFLAWFPSVPANQGAPPPPVPALAQVGAAGQAGTLIGDFAEMVSGVGQDGCGFEAQNEAWYRFLVQPDPFDHIQLSTVSNAQKAQLVGVDATILQQRHDFLRPDSLLVVVVVTDENEEVADPLSLNAQGWLFENQRFPSSSGTAPAGTRECSNPVNLTNPTQTGPDDPNCTSCAFVSATDPTYSTRCPNGGQLATTDDQLNVRFFHQKQRFGVSVSYPISRYLRGLTATTVPDSAHEHDPKGNYVGDSSANANCVNPIFAAALPSKPTDELCALTPGPRTSDLVYYAAIAGVPHQLLQVDPTDPNSPQKDVLTDADWLKITGKDPEHYDFTGIDFHMLESELPRTSVNVPLSASNSSNCPPGSAAGCDPINGGEWDTKKGDVQFSCIFQLATPRDCATVPSGTFCDCAAGTPEQSSALCQTSGGAPTTVQVAGKAYPSVREMLLAHAMGAQGIVSSLCPIHVTEQSPGDPLFGYRPAVGAIVSRIKRSILR
jgi:hypothetical protein